MNLTTSEQIIAALFITIPLGIIFFGILYEPKEKKHKPE